MIVHQVLSGAGPVDAVTGQAVAFRRLFTRWGWGGRDVAVHIDPRVDGAIRPLRTLRAAPDDVLLIHYSAYAPKLRGVLDGPGRKLVLSHNVTPARWLWGHDPTIAVQCALGRAQLPEFARAADLAAGVSAYNAAELAEAGAERTAVVPILFEPAGFGPPETSDPRHAGADRGPELLFVGRLAPHKRQDELIRLVALLRRHRLPGARLRLVGEPLNTRYDAALRDLADRVAPGAVTFERSLSREQLAGRYRAATLFVCLSEHEGFCIPLLEAFASGTPIVSRPAGGIPEVAGDAALLVEDRDLAVVAELVALAAEDPELRADLRRRGQARLAAYAPDRVAAALREAVESVASAPR